MPRAGENPLARFAHAVAMEEGFAFGAPRPSDDGSAVLLPIRRTAVRSRGYALASEVSDDVAAVDVGRIDRLRIENDFRARVFFPPGTLFEGRETSSRALREGAVLEPGSSFEANVNCVQAARPIRKGAALRVTPRLAPNPLTQACLSADQGLTWAIAAASAAASGSGSPGLPDPAKRVSDMPVIGPASGGDECGAVFLDAEGVLDVEVFDSPESMAVAARVRVPRLRWEGGLALNPAGAARIARAFLVQLAQRAYRRATPHSWSSVDRSVTYTVLDGEVIHLLAFGRDLGRPEPAETNGGTAPQASDGVPPASGVGWADSASDDADVAVAAVSDAEPVDVPEPQSSEARPRRRKVLTSGWDPMTFSALERFSQKEFGGDRSAALRSLTRAGLARRGYLGPRPPPRAAPFSPPPEPDGADAPEIERGFEATRIQDLERVAQTAQYAGWLRKRARLELERLAESSKEGRLRDAARSALDRVEPPLPDAGPIEMEETVSPPAPPPVDVSGLLRQAIGASAGGQFTQALALFDAALEADPTNLTALLGRAVAFRRAGKHQEALAGLDLVLRLDPDNAAAHLNRGRILQERGDLGGALEAFDRLAAVAPRDWDAWLERGEVLQKMGRTEDALESFREALRRNPEDEKLQHKVHTLELARVADSAVPQVVLPPGMEEGQSYLVKGETTEPAYRLLRTLARQKLPALLIARPPEGTSRSDPGLAGVRTVRLQHGPGEDVVSPAALASLSRLVDRFVEEHRGRGVILLDGVESLTANASFRDALLFVEHVYELVLQRRAIFLIALADGVLPEREAAMLERNLKVLP